MKIIESNQTFAEYITSQRPDYLDDPSNLFINCNGCSKRVDFKFKNQFQNLVNINYNANGK